MSDARCLSNQVHFFISSYPCQALQLADQQSAAVCFNQAATPLLQTGPDYREREQGRDEERRGRRRRRREREAVGGRISLPHHQCDERGEAGDMQIQNVGNGEQGGCKRFGFEQRSELHSRKRSCGGIGQRLILF